MADGANGPAKVETFRSGRGDGSRLADDDVKELSGKNVDAVGSTSGCAGGDKSTFHPEPSVTDRNAKEKAAIEGASAGPDGIYRGFCPMPTMENWPFNPSVVGSGFDFGHLGPPLLVPVLFPSSFPGYFPIPGQDQHLPPGGVFAVPVVPMFGSTGSLPQGGFIPLSFNMPPVPPPLGTDGQTHGAASPAARQMEAGRAAPQADLRDAAAPDGLYQRHVGAVAVVRQPQGAPGPGEARRPQVVRRFQVGFQLDLLLILKLAVLVIVFNQDGTKDRLVILLLLAGIVYLYQTGVLAPILRWISRSAQHAMTPPEQVREDLAPGGPAPGGPERAPGAVGAEGQGADQPPQNQNWWGIIKELQMIVVGFLTSLLPGFQHVE